MAKQIAMFHKCPVENCQNQLPSHILMCRPHWAMVPIDLKQRVYAAWNSGKSSQEYISVRQEAINSVNSQLGGDRKE
jgi:hypothetical protein